MNKLSITLLLALGGSVTAFAQQEEFLLFSSQHSLASSTALPSTFGQDGKRYYINLPSFHAWGGSDFLQLGEAKEILNGGEIPAQLVDDVMNRLDGRNYIFAGAEISPLAIGYQVRKDGAELFSINLTYTEQAAAQFQFGEYLPRVMWEGNKPFAGTRLDLGPIEGNAFLRREIALGAAFPIWADDDITMRAGFRGKFFMASTGASVNQTNAELFTAADGSLIEYDLLVKAQLAGSSSISPLANNGSGIGVDFGTSVAWGDGFSVDVALNDLGYVRYHTNITTRTFEGETVFEGFEIEEPAGGISQEEIGSFKDYFQTESTPGQTFYMGLSTRFTGRFAYRMNGLDKRGRDFAQHSFFASYVQGFGDAARSSVAPMLTGAYVFCLNNILEVGGSLGYSYDDIDFGAFMSVRGGPFRFGLGSGDFSGLLVNSSKASADVSMRMGLAF